MSELTAKRNEPIIKARVACNKELQKLRGYSAIDYEKVERQYGDSLPSAQKARIEENTSGKSCSRCPIWRQAGECAIREAFHTLAIEQRAKYEGQQREGTVNPGKALRVSYLTSMAYEGKE